MRFAKLVLLFILGYATAFLFQKIRPTNSNQPLHSRNPSSLDQISILSWSEIKCLPRQELEKIYVRVQLQEKIKSSACDDSVHGRLNQFFSYLSQTKLNLEEKKWGDLAKMFNDPIRYFESMKIKLHFDFNQAQSYAAAMPGEGVWLGRSFFDLDPVTATAVFLHETYHHDPNDPGHTRCLGGDIPQTQGGCDELFTLLPGKDRGAYSITVAYFFANAIENKSLGESQKSQLLKEAFQLMASRFVTGFEEVVALAESLAFLDLKGQIWIYHPWMRMVRQIPDPEKILQEIPATQLQFHQQKQGLFAILKNKKLFEWSYTNPFRFYYPSIIDQREEIMDATRLYLSSQEYAYTSVMKTNHRIYVVDFDQRTQKWQLLELEPNTDKIKNIPKKISTYDFFSAGVLDEEGEIWRISKGGRRNISELVQEPLYKAKNQKYKSISGGLYTDQFLGVTNKGQLFQREKNELVEWTNLPTGLMKVNEGFLNFYANTDDKFMWYWPRLENNHNAQTKKRILLPFEVFDFTVVRRLLAVSGSFVDRTQKVCGQPILFHDPYWPDMAWALDEEALMMGPKGGDDDDCRIVRQGVKSAKLAKRKPSGESTKFKSKLRPVDLEIQFTNKAPFVFESWPERD